MSAWGAGCTVSGRTTAATGQSGQKTLPSAPAVLEVPAVGTWSLPRRVASPSALIDEVLVGHGTVVLVSTTVLGALEDRGRGAQIQIVRIDATDDPFEKPLPLDPSTLPTVRPSKGVPDGPRLWIVPAGIDVDRWRATAAVVEGSCQPVEEALGRGQAGALATLEPFFVHSDQRLARRFRAELTSAWDQIDAELSEAKRRTQSLRGGGTACHDALKDLGEQLSGCANGARCDLAPRVYVDDEVFVGSAGLAEGTLGACDGIGETRLLDGIRTVARIATEETTRAMPADWVSLADRLAGLIAIYEGMHRACAPVRRRVLARDDAALDDLLDSVLDDLRRPAPVETPTWVVTDDAAHVAGLGKVARLMVVGTSTGDRARRRGLEAAAWASVPSRCTGFRSDLPLALIATAGGRVRAWALVYPEQLGCGV